MKDWLCHKLVLWVKNKIKFSKVKNRQNPQKQVLEMVFGELSLWLTRCPGCWKK